MGNKSTGLGKVPSDGRVKGPSSVDEFKNLGLNRDEGSKGNNESADPNRKRLT